MTGARLRPLVIKECRALLPAWIATLCAVVAAAPGGAQIHTLGVIAYSFGSVALGAQAIGHEYSHRTLALLLSQPIGRARLLRVKLAALSVMLLTLGLVAWVVLLRPAELLWVPATLLCAVALAPLVAMAGRSALAGAVFISAVPAWMSVLGESYGDGVVWGVMLPAFAIAAVSAWRLFMRLEAADGHGRELSLPRLVGAGGSGSPVWQLVKKELHLQQMTFVVAAVNLAVWLALVAVGGLMPDLQGPPMPVIVILDGVLLAPLIGALASAEERKMGTHDWQLLLPMSAWQQWMVKAAVVLSLALLLSFALPLALAAGAVGVLPWHAIWIVILAAGGLYVSSLCGSAIRSMMISLPILLVLSQLPTLLFPWMPALAAAGVPRVMFVTLTGLVVGLLWFGFENHRSSDPGVARVARQVAAMAATVGLGVAVVVSRLFF